jgi:hypothetical protein
MSGPETGTTGMSTSDSRKRGNEGNGSDKPTKKQKTLTKYEQQEVLLREHAGKLKQSLAYLQDVLRTFALLDDITNIRLRELSVTCDEIQLTDHQRRRHELELLQKPIPLLEGDALSGPILSE